MAKLTDKQRRFVDEYLIDLNATQAAIRAGYSEKTAKAIGQENMTKPDIRAAIDARLAEKDAALIAKQDEVLQTLTRVLRREETETVVVTVKNRRSYYDDNGKKVIEESEEPMIVAIPTRISDVNKAAELLGKRYGLYTDKVDLTGGLSIVIEDDYGNEHDPNDTA